MNNEEVFNLIATGDWLAYANSVLPIDNLPILIDKNSLYLIRLTAIDNIPNKVEFIDNFSKYSEIVNYDCKKYWASGIDHDFFARKWRELNEHL